LARHEHGGGVVADSELASRLAPLVEAAGLELYDAEVGRGLVRVTVTKPGGVDLDALTSLNSTLSRWLDEHDPLPGHYTLEVSSPGLERPLRTAAHFRSAVGETATLRVVSDGEAARRVSGTVLAADDDHVELETEEGIVTARYGEIERARTVFEWGATKAPSPSKAKPRQPRAAAKRGA
jgi:ribosome maturation factor RimP